MTTDNKKKTKPGREGENEGEPVRARLRSWRPPGCCPVSDTGSSATSPRLVFCVVIVCAFVTGVLLNGELGTPKPQNPFSWLAAFACLGNGVLYLVRSCG